jgi:hypothetical protein
MKRRRKKRKNIYSVKRRPRPYCTDSLASIALAVLFKKPSLRKETEFCLFTLE